MTILTGKQFHQENSDQTFYKFIGDNRNGYQYSEGLNVLRPGETFNPSGSCESGGLYFTDRDHSLSWLRGHHKFAEVQVPDDAQVYKEPCGSKYKASAIILGKIKPMDEFWTLGTSEIIDYAIENNRDFIQFIPSKCITESIAKKALEQDSYNIQYIPEEYQTQEAWIKAIDEYSWINIKNCADKFLSHELLKKYVQRHPYGFLYVPDKYLTPAFFKDVIRETPDSITEVPDRFLTQELVDLACGLDQNLTSQVPYRFQRTAFTHPFTRPVKPRLCRRECALPGVKLPSLPLISHQIIPFTNYRDNIVSNGPTYQPFQNPEGRFRVGNADFQNPGGRFRVGHTDFQNPGRFLGGPYIHRPLVYRYGFC